MGFRLFVPGVDFGNTVLVWNIVQPGIVLHKVTPIIRHIAAGSEVAAVIDTNIPPVCLIVDVVNQVLRHLHSLKILNIHTAQFFFVVDIGVKIEAVKVLGQID